MQSVMNESVAHDWGEGGNNAIFLRLCIFSSFFAVGEARNKKGRGEGDCCGCGGGKEICIFFSGV